MEFDSYSLVLLRSGPSAHSLPPAELDRLQAAHLAHLRSMRDAGKIVASGPFENQPDVSMRGLCLYSCELDEARALANDDPSVRAGRLAVEVMTWLTPRGTLTFPPS